MPLIDISMRSSDSTNMFGYRIVFTPIKYSSNGSILYTKDKVTVNVKDDILVSLTPQFYEVQMYDNRGYSIPKFYSEVPDTQDTVFFSDMVLNGIPSTLLDDNINTVIGNRGEKGIQGPPGTQGIKGDTGATGLQGIQGSQGIQGEKGEKGDTGLQGERGLSTSPNVNRVFPGYWYFPTQSYAHGLTSLGVNALFIYPVFFSTAICDKLRWIAEHDLFEIGIYEATGARVIHKPKGQAVTLIESRAANKLYEYTLPTPAPLSGQYFVALLNKTTQSIASMEGSVCFQEFMVMSSPWDASTLRPSHTNKAGWINFDYSQQVLPSILDIPNMVDVKRQTETLPTILFHVT